AEVPLQFDVFNTLRKNIVHPTGMGSPLNAEIVRRIRETDRYRELRGHTIADDFAAGLASCGVAREVVSEISDETKKKAEEEARARAEAADARAYADALADDPDADPDDLKDAERDAAEKQDAAQKAARALQRAIQGDGKKV